MGYEVAGQCLSFRDLGGVLRGNVVPPADLLPAFWQRRPAARFRHPSGQPHPLWRIRSSIVPADQDFTAEAIDEELRIVAMAFCEQEENVRVDTESRTLCCRKSSAGTRKTAQIRRRSAGRLRTAARRKLPCSKACLAANFT